MRIGVRVPEKAVPKVNDAHASRHSDGPPTEHRMTDIVLVIRCSMHDGFRYQELVATVPRHTPLPVMHPQATTSPSHRDTSSVHGEWPRAIPEKNYDYLYYVLPTRARTPPIPPQFLYERYSTKYAYRLLYLSPYRTASASLYYINTILVYKTKIAM